MKIEEILSNQKYQYPDEKVESNLYLISLCTSMRRLVSIEENMRECESKPNKYKQRCREYEQACEDNEWLRKECPKCEAVPVFALDKVKEYVDSDMRSCDGFFYHAQKSENKLSLLIELKNVNKSKMLDYMESKDKDSLYLKVCDSLELISNRLEFEDGYSGKELIEHTHLVVVYGGRADTASSGNIHFGEKTAAEKNEKGRQSKAANFRQPSFKYQDIVLDRFGEKIKKTGLASCPFKYFGVPSREPREVKGEQGKERTFTMFSKENMRKVIEDCGFFDDWDWGKYSMCFDSSRGCLYE